MTMTLLQPMLDSPSDPKCFSPEDCQYTGGGTCEYCSAVFGEDFDIEWPVYDEALGG